MNVATEGRTFSHGTLEVVDLQASVRFYRELLELDVAVQSPKTCIVSLQEGFGIVCLETGKRQDMPLTHHHGIRVASRGEVDRWHARITGEQERYGISQVTSLRDLHGEYQFYFRDLDNNWWEFHVPSGDA